jgi:hypothetical protein
MPSVSTLQMNYCGLARHFKIEPTDTVALPCSCSQVDKAYKIELLSTRLWFRSEVVSWNSRAKSNITATLAPLCPADRVKLLALLKCWNALQQHFCCSLRDGYRLAMAVSANEEVIALKAVTKSPRTQEPKTPNCTGAQLPKCCKHLLHRAVRGWLVLIYPAIALPCCSLRTRPEIC